MLKSKFWNKKLSQLNKEEWEALCDRCGKCCLIKLEEINTKKIFYTNVSCKLLCTKTAHCKNYVNRKNIVKDCTTLNYKNIKKINWLPKTCSYRLRNEGKDLPSWHYLISGNFNEMKKKDKCVRNRVTNEEKVDIKNIQNYIINWDTSND